MKLQKLLEKMRFHVQCASRLAGFGRLFRRRCRETSISPGKRRGFHVRAALFPCREKRWTLTAGWLLVSQFGL